jgi:hypothetical protein
MFADPICVVKDAGNASLNDQLGAFVVGKKGSVATYERSSVNKG